MPFSPEFDLLPYNFLGLAPSASTYADARAVVFPIPYEATVSFHSGTRRGPQAMMLASRQVELYDPAAGCEAGMEIGVHTLGELIINTTGPESTLRLVREAAQSYVDDGKFLMSFGGEHSITSALVEAHTKKYPKIAVLQIDAHLDLRDRWLGTEWSHASVMRRLVSRGHRVQAVGIRNISAEESAFVAQAGLDPVLADQVDSSGRWIDRALAGLGDAEEVYVSVDLDGLDPSVIRAVGTPEPAGLSWRQTIELLTAVAARKRIVGADLVELCPQPGDLASDFAAAKLAYKLLTLAFYSPAAKP